MKDKFTRTITQGSVLALIAVILTGCASEQAGKDNTTGKISFANYTDASPLFGAVAEGVELAADAGGFDVSLFDNKADAQVTLENATLMVQGAPDVIVEYSPDPSLGASLSSQFKNADIPCIALNVPTEGCDWLNVVNANGGMQAGELAAEWAAGEGWNGTNTTVLLLGNAVAGEDVNDTVRYFYTSFAEHAEGFKGIQPEEITATTTRIADNALQVDGAGSLDGGFEAVQAALQNIPSDQNIILTANNDDASMGGWRAIEEAGRADTSAVIGFGGSSAALGQLQDNPRWIIEADALMSVWGYYAVAMSAAILDGVEPPELTEMPYVILTKDNLNDFYPESFDRPVKLPDAIESNEYLYEYDILRDYSGE